MEEVLVQLQTTVLDPENNQTSFDGLYKNWGKFSDQEQRRKDILDTQKQNRSIQLDTTRGILDIVNSVEKHHSHHQDRYRPSIHVAGFTRASYTYKNVLMFSEWLIEKPEDFESNWVVVPCPKGARSLVVSYQGKTKCYNKYGTFRTVCHTALPGGNPEDSYNKNQCVVLDCFYVESIKTMFILDVLLWTNQPMTEGETEFRHYWVKSKIEEIPEIKTINSKNELIFEMLPKVPCKPDLFNEFMMKAPHFENSIPKLDGLLFYHQRASYISGVTPLVGWLYPYMVNEVLGSEITVNPIYLTDKPNDYVNQTDFIQKFDAKTKRRQSKSSKKSAETMDTYSEVQQGEQDIEIDESTHNDPSIDSEAGGCIIMDPDTALELKPEISISNGHLTPIQSVDGC